MIPSAGRMIFSFLFLVTFHVHTAQSDNTALGIEIIRAHFQGAGLVPSLLANFTPSALLTATYGGVGIVTPGQLLSKSQTQTAPNLTITPANITTLLNGKYTVVMVDAWAPGYNDPRGQICHWVVNGVTIQDHSVSTRGSVEVEQYRGPTPPSGSGAHRYVILLYAQQFPTVPPPQGFPIQSNDPGFCRLADYVKVSNIGPLIAGTYFTVEEGTATFTPSPTSPVVTSTLLASGSSDPSKSASTDVQHNGAFSSSSNYLTIFLAPFLWLVAL
ncbi:phosphatidylethanolamine-binding protein [Suillus clintonianus]|uniref:phosphatidylethanolamine-binding protein n=1 Tax=Suillus clintonianus TaxID=1904413 RepID=UPI001B87207C|nr:phosphatidylethanolamine-binding protein [Suillus clintonianus]KAG2149186.1 phosphatidylethanolamine-binding protein [Suillus clintonianus]